MVITMGLIEDVIFYFLPEPYRNQYLIALLILVGFVVLSKAAVFIIEKIALAFASKTTTKFDDLLFERANQPISWLLVFIGMKLAFEYVNYVGRFDWIINNIILSLIYVASSMLIVSVVVVSIDTWGGKLAKKTKSTIDDALIPLFRTSSKVAIMIIIAIMVLSMWGINVSGLLAGVGIAGIAIGFAVKDSLANIFGGISLIIDKTFNIDDKIELGDGTVGIVTDVGIRSTRIRTFDNELLIIPNGIVANSKIKNFYKPNMKGRVAIPFGVEYGSKIENVKKWVLEEIDKMDNIVKDDPEPQVIFLEMADSSLNFSVRFWVEDMADFFVKKEEATTRIYNLLNRKKIGIPFPTQTVYVRK